MFPLDALRGLIIVLMALDHANSFIARGKLEPEMWADMFPNYYGDALAFLTRLVTHLAAPGFFFLLGIGMTLLALSRRRQGWGRWHVMGHLMVRGVLLILLQFCVENPAWQFGQIITSPTYYGVLYALGGAMLVGTLFLYLPTSWLVGLSALLIILTDLLLPGVRTGSVEYAPVLRLWLLPGYTPGMFVLYPVMPWLGVAGLGMAYGRWLDRDRRRAYQGALGLGAAALLLFIPIRWLGDFGNIRPMQGTDWIAWLNVVKYPPSIVFLLLTLGANLVLLSLLARAAPVVGVALWPLAVLGRVPLFFYVAHLYLYAGLGQWLAADGLGIPRMIPYWLLGLALLFPLCWLYGWFKHSRPPSSPWRFL